MGGRWFVFLLEPCAAGKDVRSCKSVKDWCQVSTVCTSGWQGQQ